MRTVFLCNWILFAALVHPTVATTAEAPLPTGAIARLGTSQARIFYPWALQISADGKQLHALTQSNQGYLEFDLESGHLRKSAKPKASGHHVSADLMRTFSLTTTKKLLCSETLTGKVIAEKAIPVKGFHGIHAVSPDGKRAAVYSSPIRFDPNDPDGVYKILVFDVDAENPIIFDGLVGQINHATFSPDGKRLVVLCWNMMMKFADPRQQVGEVVCFDLATKKRIWTVAREGVFGASMHSPDGKMLAHAKYNSNGHQLEIWDAETGKLSQEVPLPKTWNSTPGAFSPDGSLLIFGDENRLQAYDLKERKTRFTLPVSASRVKFTSDGASLITTSPKLQRWDVKTGKPLWEDTSSQGHLRPIAVGPAVSPDGKWLITSDSNETLMWDLATRKPTRWKRPMAGMPIFTPDSKMVLVPRKNGYGDTYLIGNDPATEKELLQLSTAGTFDSKLDVTLTTLQWSAPNRLSGVVYLAEDSIGEGSATITWDLTTKKVIENKPVMGNEIPQVASSDWKWSVRGAALTDHVAKKEMPLEHRPKESIGEAIFSPDGKAVGAVTFGGGSAKGGKTSLGFAVWHTENGKLIQRLPLRGSEQIFLGAGGKTVVAVVATRIAIWDTEQSKEVRAITAPELDGEFRRATMLPDGKTLAVIHPTGTVLLWDVSAKGTGK